LSDCQATNKGWHALKQQAAGRYSALSAAKQAHAFDRDAAEIEARIAEKDRLVSVNDYGQDLVSVEALQRKHEVFARDLAALGDGVAAVSEDGKRLATATPSNGSDIRAKMEQVQDQWTALSTKAQARKTRLDDSYDLQRFFNDLRTSLAWITDMKSLMQAEEVANDVAGAEALLQRHQEHRDEIQARVETFKAVVDFGNALILKGHFATDELEQGLVGLKAARDGLDALHASRQTEFEESLASQLFFRDAEQVEAWMASRENLLASDDVGDSLDSVDALMKKHGDFERNLKAQEDKPRALDENRRKLVQSGHTQAAAITERCDAVLERRAQLLQAAKARRQLLVDARKYEEFKRDADEVEAWMSEKAQTASDPSYKDATNLRGKLKNHEAFQAELTANGTRIAAAVSSGQSLVDSDHFAKVAIQERLVALQQQWDELNAHSSDKAQKLQEAHEQQEFNRRVDDINAWCEETETALASEDNGRDLPHVQKLLKKHQLMEADVTGQRERVDNTLAQGKRMVDAANFQSPAIEAKMAALTDRYAALAAPLAARKQTLDASLQLQQFLRNSEDEESWIREKEPAVASTNYGNSLTAVQNHQKKHNALKAEIAGRNKAVQAVLTTADGLLGQDHFGHATIAGKREGLAAQWEQLNSLSAHRGDVLQEALLVQQYLADANEADAWIGEKEPVVSSDNYGKDEDSALALLKKHEAVEAELRTYQRTIDSLHTDSQKCSALAESRSSAPAATAASAKVKMTVLFDFEADNDRKLSVAKGQVVELISKDSSGWCHVRNDSGKAGFVPANYLKETASRVSPVPALGSGSPVKDGANLSPETITSRQNSLEASYAELLSQAGQRRKRLQETQQLHQLNREMDEVESWMNSREAVASQTELGTDLEHNELLQKKFEDFNKDLNANETRVKSANGLATQLLDAGHSDGAVIAQRRDALNTRWSQLQALALERQAALQAAHEVHQFQRHVDDTVARFGEKDVVLSLNEYGRDVASVEALQRKHDGAIRDLAALEGKVQDLRQEADRLATAQPQAAPDVQGKRQEIDTAWAELQRKAADRKHRLAEALRFQKFLGEHRDLSSWTTGMITLASSDELARDAAGAEALLKRHQDLQTEIDARSDGIAAFRANSQKLLSDDHEKAGDIAAKTQELDRELQQLQDQMGARQQVLEQCHELQAFNRSAEQVEAWIAAREGPLASDDVGTTLDSVEAMLKKHQDFEQSLVPQSDKVREVATEAHRLIQDGHYDADGIESRKRAVQDRWTRLQELADSRKAKLNAALAVQRFHRDADEAEAWITEKAQVAADPSYKDPSNLTGKLQKHQAFEAEVAANEARIFAVVDTGRKVMRENPDGSGSVPPRIASLEEQWALLQESTNDKAQKLQEAGSQQQFNHSVEDIEFWLSEIEVQLSTNDKGRDLPSVQNLIKKHQLIEADIDAHKERMDAIHSQADHFAEQGHFDAPAISQKYQQLEQRYRAVQTMSGQRSGSLTDALKLQQILRDIEDELAWIKEKERLAASTDFGKDLTGVQNLQKKHLAFDAELKGHEGRIFAVVDAATALIKTGHYATDELTHKSQDLEQQWAQLKALSEARRHKLGEAVEFQLLRTGLDEEESWINEKLSAMANDDVPDTLSGAQALVKKHEAFEGDLQEHRTSVDTLATEGQGLVSQGNYQAPEIQSSLSNLRSLLASLQEAADSRKGVLGHRYDFLRLSREADSIEAWIEDKEPQAASADYGKDLAASQALTTKQDTFDASVSAFRPRINAFQTLLADLVSKKNSHIGEAQTREEMVMQRWRNLLAAAEKRRVGLSRLACLLRCICSLVHFIGWPVG
jgi:spectrin alpha